MGEVIKPGLGPNACMLAFAVGVLAIAQPASGLASAALASVALRDVARSLPQATAPAALSPSRAVRRGLLDRPRTYVPPLSGPGPLGAFLYDRTLRHGDVVATSDGLLIFEGRRRGAEHQAADFKPVASSRSIGVARRAQLVELERTMRQTPSNVIMLAEAMEPRSFVILKRLGDEAEPTVVTLGAPSASLTISGNLSN